jgi:hypothetical protein
MQRAYFSGLGFLGFSLVLILAASAPVANAASGVAVSGQAVHSSNTVSYTYQGFNEYAFALGNPSFTYTTPNIVSVVDGSAEAEFGTNRIFNSVSIGSNNNEFAYSRMRSSWVDSVLISDPELDGEAGVFNGVIYVDMDYSSSGTPGSINNNFFSVGVGNAVGNSSYASVGFDLSGAQSYNSTPVAFSISFTFGTAFDFAVNMTSYIGLSNGGNLGGGGSITHNAANTVTWGGVVSVQDSSFQVVNPGDYSLSSTSGTNYLSPIPEPSSVLLVLGAIGAVCGFRRRTSR